MLLLSSYGIFFRLTCLIHLIFYVHVPCSNAAGVLFIYVPKAAGVSVNRTLYGEDH